MHSHWNKKIEVLASYFFLHLFRRRLECAVGIHARLISPCVICTKDLVKDWKVNLISDT